MELSAWGVLLLHCICAAAENVHTVYWNSTNRSLWKGYTLQVQLSDYLDVICPHYEDNRVSGITVERYSLYRVNQEEYETCKPESKEKVCWECKNPFNLNGPEKFREKFQKYTAFSRGKEFKEGQTYYYISKPIHHHGESCLKLKVQVTCKATQQPATNVHSPGARAAADDPAVALPDVQRSVANNSADRLASFTFCGLLLTFLLFLGL